MNGRLRNNTQERRAFVVFMISLGLTLAALFGGIFIGVNVRNVQMVKDGVLDRGRALFRQIVLTRRWAAGYGGVYVPKKQGVVSNPWLDHPDLLAADGSTLTLRNPALMTREISEIGAQSEGYRFRITSLKPLNPANGADPFEQDALLAFEAGVHERWATVTGSGGKEFRYMGALLAEPSCMTCHAAQGYRVGDVRGGISVRFPVEGVEVRIRNGMIGIGLAVFLALLLTMGLVWRFVAHLRLKLDDVRGELELQAMTDALTGLYNRRYGLERLLQEAERARRRSLPLACAILDVDDFKKVNDTRGRAAGNDVLRTLAHKLRTSLRPYDISMRFGGEEFVLVFPETALQAAVEACDRIRVAFQEADGTGITVSAGVAGMQGEVSKEEALAVLVERLLREADSALYRAKAEGKNRVAFSQG